MTQLQPGDVAPPLRLPDAHGDVLDLRDVLARGRRALVAFYPAAMTAGCTVEACEFRERLEDFQAAGVDVLMVSPDDPDTLRQFADHEDLAFPLLSDVDHRSIDAWGAWGTKVVDGKEKIGVIRSSVVVAPDGRVEAVAYGVKPAGHAASMLATLSG